MQWLKAWLRKWLGVEQLADRCSVDTAGLIRHREVLTGEVVNLGLRVENLREHYASVKEMGDACMARLDRETMKLAIAIGDLTDKTGNAGMGLARSIDDVRAELIDIVKVGERDARRISELTALVKDGTVDTTLAELEDRVAKLESNPAPAASSPQGRRGGSAWNSHQVAAAQGAALANGMPIPIPTPGIS